MIILASASQRRIELLKDSGVEFEVIPSEIEEVIDVSLSPVDNAMKIALTKARDIYFKNKNATVIAADTMVVYNNEIFGKPESEEDAFEILKTLSNKKHKVITGVAIIHNDEEDVFFSESTVKFKDLTDEEIKAYIDTKEPFGKAGGYAIQGLGKDIVDTYEGDFFTIVGLPLKEVLKKLNDIKNKKDQN